MAKREADIQLSKEGSFVGDGSEAVADTDLSLRATAAQMAKRKVATIKGRAKPGINQPHVPLPPVQATMIPNLNAANGQNGVSSTEANGTSFQSSQSGFTFTGQSNPTTSSAPAGSSFNFGAPTTPTFFTNNYVPPTAGGYQGTIFTMPAPTAPAPTVLNEKARKAHLKATGENTPTWAPMPSSQNANDGSITSGPFGPALPGTRTTPKYGFDNIPDEEKRSPQARAHMAKNKAAEAAFDEWAKAEKLKEQQKHQEQQQSLLEEQHRRARVREQLRQEQEGQGQERQQQQPQSFAPPASPGPFGSTFQPPESRSFPPFNYASTPNFASAPPSPLPPNTSVFSTAQQHHPQVTNIFGHLGASNLKQGQGRPQTNNIFGHLSASQPAQQPVKAQAQPGNIFGHLSTPQQQQRQVPSSIFRSPPDTDMNESSPPNEPSNSVATQGNSLFGGIGFPSSSAAPATSNTVTATGNIFTFPPSTQTPQHNIFGSIARPQAAQPSAAATSVKPPIFTFPSAQNVNQATPAKPPIFTFPSAQNVNQVTSAQNSVLQAAAVPAPTNPLVSNATTPSATLVPSAPTFKPGVPAAPAQSQPLFTFPATQSTTSIFTQSAFPPLSKPAFSIPPVSGGSHGHASTVLEQPGSIFVQESIRSAASSTPLDKTNRDANAVLNRPQSSSVQPVSGSNEVSGAQQQGTGSGFPTSSTSLTTLNPETAIARAAQVYTSALDVDVPSPPSHFTDIQKDQYDTLYRIRCLDAGLRRHVMNSSLNSFASEFRVMQFYTDQTGDVLKASAVKRKAVDAIANPPAKRVNMSGSALDEPDTQAPAPSMPPPPSTKRKATEDIVKGSNANGVAESDKKARPANVSYPSLPEPAGSQTYKLFANITNGSNAPQTSAALTGTPKPAAPRPSSDDGDMTNGAPKVSPFDAPADATWKTKSTNMFVKDGTSAEEPVPCFRAPLPSEMVGSKDGVARSEASTEKPVFDPPYTVNSIASASTPIKPPIFNLQAPSTAPAAPPKFTIAGPPKFGASGGTNFLAQFGEAAKKSEAEAKAKRKLEDFDSDDEDDTLEGWEKRDAEEQKAKRAKLAAEVAKVAGNESLKFKVGSVSAAPATSSDASVFKLAKSPVFKVPGTPISDTATDSVFGNPGKGKNSANDVHGAADEPKPASTFGRSLFDRIPTDAAGQPVREIRGEDATTAEPVSSGSTAAVTPNKTVDSGIGKNMFSQPSTPPKVNPFAASTATSSNGFGNSIFSKPPTTPKGNPFAALAPSTTPGGVPGNSFLAQQSTTPKTNPFAASTASSSPGGDNTWNPGSPIKFSGFGKAATPAVAPAISLTKPTPPPPVFGSLFGAPEQKPPGHGYLFGDKKAPVLGASSAGLSAPPFKTMGSSDVGFVFGSSSKLAAEGLAPPSVVNSNNTSRATSPGVTTGEDSNAEAEEDNEAREEQLDLGQSRAGEEGEDLLFEVRAKARQFASVAEGSQKAWLVRGVGSLRVLKSSKTNKTRMVLRSEPSAKIVLNSALMKEMKYPVDGEKGVRFGIVTKDGKLEKWHLTVGKKEDAAKLSVLLEKEKAD